MRIRSGVSTLAVCFGLTAVTWAQDPVKVDPRHYSIICENNQVRVLKVHYGPHEKSVLHSHPALVLIFLTDTEASLTFKEGKRSHLLARGGDALYSPPVVHLPENTSDKAWEVIEVELKQRGGSD